MYDILFLQRSLQRNKSLQHIIYTSNMNENYKIHTAYILNQHIYTQRYQAHTTTILFMHTHEHICIHFLEKTPRIGIMPKLGFQTVTLHIM